MPARPTPGSSRMRSWLAAANAPVAFENRSVLRPFEPLASFVSMPRYGSLDPTPFLAVTFPVFVGLMVGDIGYGLILLAVLAWARRRWPRSSLLSQVLPIAVRGTHDALPKHSWRFGHAKAFVTVGDPIDTAGMTLDDVPRLRDEARRRVEALRERLART